MKRLASILLLLLMLLQAIPVLHFFFEKKAVFYSLIDEEKPSGKSSVEKKEGKEFLATVEIYLPVKTSPPLFTSFSLYPYVSPLIEALTPPPNL